MINKIRVDKTTIYFSVNSNKNYSFVLISNGNEVYKTNFYCNTDNEYFISHPSIVNNKTKLIVDQTQKIKLQPKIHHIIPWKTETNKVGDYLNQIFELIDDEDWICFLDGDAMHTTTWFGKRIEETINKNLDFSMFSCLTNRTTPTCQIALGSDWEDNDISNHRKLGELLWETNQTKVTDVTEISPVSGYFFLVKKQTWKDVGGFNNLKMLGIEWDFCEKVKKINGKIGVMNGIYVYHWYRGGDKFNNTHLK
jgi:hypothetical protein